MLASIWRTVWNDVFWDGGHPTSIPRAIEFDAVILLALVVLALGGMGRLRKRGNGPEGDASAEDGHEPGLRPEVGGIASRLNPLHHESLPPFPGTLDDEPK